MNSDSLRTEINCAIEALEEAWAGTDAFSDAQRKYLLRRTEVAYVGQSSSVKANAAGGRYRGRVGRALFRTEALFQHVLDEGVAVNVIQFRLLNLIKGCAVLPGRWSRPSAKMLGTLREEPPSRPLTSNTICVRSDAPRLAFGGGAGLLNMQFGPSSEVALDTTYLDDTLRICRGATSGTPFVFRADTCADGMKLADASQQWQLVTAKTPLGKRPLIITMLSAARALDHRQELTRKAARWSHLHRSSRRRPQHRRDRGGSQHEGARRGVRGGGARGRESVEALKRVVEEQERLEATPQPNKWVEQAQAAVLEREEEGPSTWSRATSNPWGRATRDEPAPTASSSSSPASPAPSPASPLRILTRRPATAVTINGGVIWGAPPDGFEWGELY